MTDAVIGRGWPFPLRLVRGRLELIGGEVKIRQSLWLVLKTTPGSRLMRPDFGCGLDELVLSANTASLRGLVAERVREAVLRFEPRIDLVGVRIESDADARNRLLIEISYRIRGDNSVFNLIYPLYLLEGAGAASGGVPGAAPG
jgi:phage baseplate assembly protein W